MSQKVVARFRDGRVMKGTSTDVDSSRPTFHLREEDGDVYRVRLEHLKALFFVRTLDGDPRRHERRILDPDDPRARAAVVMTAVFEDGEVVTGMTMRYPPRDAFFFLIPVDTGSNNVRILVNRAAVAVMERVPVEREA